MSERGSSLVTLLFTDLVASTELLARAGDEQAQRIFRAHHQLLSEAVAAHGGHEVKWLGDGLMVAFPSAAEAIRCAVAMQRASRRPVQGERLAIRVGLNAGEALREVADYFGTAVVIARRLCDRADGGQILCTETVVGLLAGRAEFEFVGLGRLELKGVPEPVAAREVRYDVEPALGVTWRTDFFGRDAELRRLAGRLGEAGAGRGGLVTLTGEPGIGKTRLAEELAERARREGVPVVWGRCLESEWSPPYAPFAEALDAQVAASEPENLRADLGAGASPVAQLVPRVRQVLPDVPEPAPVLPDEERFRLLDAVAQFLVARSRRAPVLLCLDDLQWADRGSIAMLRHVARFAPRERLLIVGTYRDAEVDRTHPLADALAALRREIEYERIDLRGLVPGAVGDLIAAFADHEVSPGFVAAVSEETDGNPFFVRELIRYFVEVGKVYRDADGRWTSGRPIRELGIPEGVREVVGRRLSRLGEAARHLLAAASAFEGPFRFEVVTAVAALREDDALDAVDEALAAQLIQPANSGGDHVFAHALIRHAVYDELSSPRRARLHRRVAEALEQAYGEGPLPVQAGEIASQYHRSAELPGAERGVEHAVAAAGYAHGTGAYDTAAHLLRIALELLPETDPRRPRLLGDLGLALAWALRFDEALQVADEAAAAITAADGIEEAAEYLSEATLACAQAGATTVAWKLAARGLALRPARRDVAWARLVTYDHERASAENPAGAGIPLESPERTESARILRAARLDPMGPGPAEAVFDSRAEVLESSNLVVQFWWGGESAGLLPRFVAEEQTATTRGQILRASRCWAGVTYCLAALGRLEEAAAAQERAEALAERVGLPNFVTLLSRALIVEFTGEGDEEFLATMTPLGTADIPPLAWARAFLWAFLARLSARRGRCDEALAFVARGVTWLERAPVWTVGLTVLAAHAAEALWVLERADHIDTVERALREKVIAPDFRSGLVDGRLALARLCAIRRRFDEAATWFAEARRVLTEQGARPLLAITDHDEALMNARRGAPGDTERARFLLGAARRQFEALGMTGWIRRAEELRGRLEEADSAGALGA